MTLRDSEDALDVELRASIPQYPVLPSLSEAQEEELASLRAVQSHADPVDVLMKYIRALGRIWQEIKNVKDDAA